MAEIGRLVAILVITSVALLSAAFLPVEFTGAYNMNVTAGGTTLVLWDDTDSYDGGPYTRYTYPNSYDTYGPICYKVKALADYNVYFRANYTNSTDDAITNLTGSCMIRFDANNDTIYESWNNMSYNTTLALWEYNRSFTYKDILMLVNQNG